MGKQLWGNQTKQQETHAMTLIVGKASSQPSTEDKHLHKQKSTCMKCMLYHFMHRWSTHLGQGPRTEPSVRPLVRPCSTIKESVVAQVTRKSGCSCYIFPAFSQHVQFFPVAWSSDKPHKLGHIGAVDHWSSGGPCSGA